MHTGPFLLTILLEKNQPMEVLRVCGKMTANTEANEDAALMGCGHDQGFRLEMFRSYSESLPCFSLFGHKP
jgi:hypothetical protein